MYARMFGCLMEKTAQAGIQDGPAPHQAATPPPPTLDDLIAIYGDQWQIYTAPFC